MEIRAGIKAFEKFGFYNTVNSLAGGDVLRWQEILNLPYEIVFLKQLLNKTEFGFQKKKFELEAKERERNLKK